MDKKNIIIKFNNIIRNLLDQTKNLVGGSYLVYYDQITKVNSLKPIETFIYYALPFKEQIISEDPQYFLEESNLKKDFSGEYDEYFTDIIKLKKIYCNVDDTSKSNLWKILKALVILSDKYNQL
uniref:Uncharacterized protein n=1 Tax=Megaviridae environmental sample TaxID=1737588 RepID=A0A5J6VKJ9_9VIRU|nr:MAG: hypothetical protein [Megaviridae environmental sample]